jgi:putative ABC transport system permease protein
MIRLARRLLACALPADVRAAMLAELDAEYARSIRPSRSAPRAAAWYWMQVAGSIAPALAMRRRRLLRDAAMNPGRWLSEAAQDGRFGARLLARQKGFTAAAVSTLALGIGATTAVFSLVDGVLLRPLPYGDPEQLVRIWSANPRGIARNGIAPPDYFDWRDRSRGFSALAAFASAEATLTGAGDPVQLAGATATANLAPLLGVRPLVGRWFTADETAATPDGVVVIGESLWRERFGGSARIIGAAVHLDGRVRTVVGVMPRTFQFPSADARIWLPLPDAWRAQPRNAHFLGAVGRLEPGVTLEAGRDSLRTVARALEQAYPDSNRGWGITVVSLKDSLVGDVRRPLVVLLAAVAAVLLIACANVAGLMLARGVARSRELAVRAAVGAGAGRLLRQQLVEALLLSALGGAAGLALASWAVAAVGAARGLDVPLLDRVALDGRAVLVTVGVSLLSAAITGLLPAWRASRQDSSAALGGGTRTTGDHVRVRQAIVFAQIAVATALVAAGALLLKSFDRLTAVPSGFNAERTMLADVSLPSARYTRDARAPFFDRALERLRALPGVEAAGAGGPLPLSGQDGLLRFGIVIQGRPSAPDRPDRSYLRWATPGYFSAMGIQQRAGRAFNEADHAGSAPVAVIDEELARTFFAGEDPLGRRIRLSNERTTWREIVGIVGAVRQTSLDRSADPHVYVPQAQLPSFSLTLVVRGAGDAATTASGVRDVVRSLDSDLPLSNVRSLDDLVAGSTASRRMSTLLLVLFAAAALALTLVGVYGVASQAVAQSTREIGVRIALGASGSNVVSLVVGRACKISGAGVAAGSVAAWMAAPALGGMVYGVAPRDPATLIVAASVLIATSALGAYLPARSIRRVDVVNALRIE